jgi:nucleoside-diphosphate-sugar epimerase
MNIIITGADGFIGVHLINQLRRREHKLLLIGGDKILLEKKFGDIAYCLSYKETNQIELQKSFLDFQPEIVIHLAAYSTESDNYLDMEELVNANLLFTCKILDALKNASIKYFIFTGSSTEYFMGDGILNPAYLYSATKSASRPIIKYYANTYNFKHIIVCPYNVYGDIDSRINIIDIIYKSLGSEKPIDTTKGEQELDFIHILDIVGFYIKCIDNINSIPNETCFQAGTGKGYTLKELAILMEKESGEKANINWGGLDYRKRDVMKSVADISLQKKILNWRPGISLEKGLNLYFKAKQSF